LLNEQKTAVVEDANDQWRHMGFVCVLKASKQSWFSNVFGTAADDEEELNKTEKPIRRKF